MSDINIVYIDDEKENLVGFELAYQKYYSIFTTQHIDEAVQIINTKKIQIVISDQRMPEKLGTQFCEELNQSHPNIVKIILTAYSDTQAAIDAINKGQVYHFMNKPYDIEYFKNVIDKAAETYDLRARNKKLLKELQITNTELESALIDSQNNEIKFRTIFENIHDGYFSINSEGEILLANPALTEITGYANDEFKNMNVCSGLFFSSSEFQQIKKKLKSKEKHFSIEKRFIDKHKNFKIIELILQVQNDKNSNEYYEGFIRDITQRKETERLILDTVIRTEEKERANFAEEIHDGLGPIFSTVKLYIQAANEENSIKERKTILNKTELSINEAISSLREISNNISPHVLRNFGLVSAIRSFSNRITELKGINIKISSNIEGRLQENIETTIYRVLTELTNNTVKHAKATKIVIDIKKTQNHISVHYNDNGVGFDINKQKIGKSGFGLVNIQNRIRSLNGEIKISSQKGKGLKATIKIILDNLA